MARINSLTLFNGKNIITEEDVVTAAKNGLMTPELYEKLLNSSNKDAQTYVYEFNTSGSDTKIFSISYEELGISSPVLIQLIDNEGLIRDDLLISYYWTSTGLSIDLSQVEPSGVWKVVYTGDSITISNLIIPAVAVSDPNDDGTIQVREVTINEDGTSSWASSPKTVRYDWALPDASDSSSIETPNIGVNLSNQIQPAVTIEAPNEQEGTVVIRPVKINKDGTSEWAGENRIINYNWQIPADT